MENELILDLLRVFVKHKKMPETILRNEEINMLYRQMRRDGSKGRDTREELADRYCTSVKNIETILYGRRRYVNS